MAEKIPLRVLIAEDDFLISEEVARTARSLGYEVDSEAAAGASTSLRLHARLSLKSQRIKRFLRRNTLLGRFARPPLEVGLE